MHIAVHWTQHINNLKQEAAGLGELSTVLAADTNDCQLASCLDKKLLSSNWEACQQGQKAVGIESCELPEL